MKNILIRIASIIAFFILSNQVLAQSTQDLVNRMMPKPVPTSPNVSALGKFGDYQVSNFSGLPEISIPLYEVQSGSLKLPIVLSYHASGIKPTDVASWVGAGWSISAGGQISRIINGKLDEEGYSSTPLKSNLSVCGSYYYLKYAALNVTDTEPDIFSYSFGGKRGKFMWMYNRTPYLIPYAPLKLTASGGLGTFEITDESGVLHGFGQNGSVEPTTATSGGNPTSSGITAWHMTKMVAPNSDDLISLDYQSVGTFNTHDISYTYAISDECYSSNGGVCPTNTFTSQLHNIDSYGTQKGPSTITFETGKVKFFLSNGFRSDASQLKYLDRIEVQSLEGVVQKTVQFVYSYFTNAIGGSAALKLDAVQFKDKSGVKIQEYKFDYHTNSFSWNPNNINFLNARDLWGYYNGATTNTDLLLPKTITYQQTTAPPRINLSFGGALDRAVNPQYVKEGVLKRINFPTGGYSEFEYESNKYLDGTVPTLAGGLRVTKIISSDGTNALPIVKTYKYGNGESGFGKPNFSEQQFNYSNSQMYYGCGAGVNPFVEFQSRTFHSNSAFNFDPFDSSPVVYPFVTEYLGDPLGINNGKISYVYDNGISSGDVNHVVPTSSKFYRNSFFWQRGKLTTKTIYDRLSNKLSETNITYSTFKQEIRFVGVGVYEFMPQTPCTAATCINEVGETVGTNSLFFTPYYQNGGVLLETSIAESNFQNGDISKSVSTAISHTYDPDKLQILESSRTRSMETISTVNKYPFELSSAVNASSTGAAQGIFMLNTKNILNTPVESYSYLQKPGGDILISSQVSTYKKNDSNEAHVVPDQIFLWESAVPVLKSSYIPISVNGTNSGLVMNSNLKPRVTMSHYDERGNIISALKINDRPSSYSFGYNKSLPVVEIRNAVNSQYQTIQNGIVAVTLGGPTTGVIQASYPFTVDYTGPVVLKLGVAGTPTFETVATYSGISGSSVTLGKGSCGATTIAFGNVTPGNYTLVITLTTPNTGIPHLGACGEITYPKNSIVNAGFIEFLYEGFEESTTSGVVTGPLLPQSGKKYFQGDYLVSFSKPSVRNYIIEYFYFDSATSKWILTSKPYSGTSMTLNEGTAIDNVRIRPVDSSMSTYTYDPVIGVSSITDSNNITTYYIYDSFGRLEALKDYAGNIVTTYKYNYKK